MGLLVRLQLKQGMVGKWMCNCEGRHMVPQSLERDVSGERFAP